VAGAWAETELQLNPPLIAGRRSTLPLLLGMLAWIVAGFAGAILAASVFGFAAVLSGFPVDLSRPHNLILVLVGAGGFQGTLLWGAVWQGQRAGGGNWRVGTGFWPVSRPSLVTGLCALMFGWLITFLLLLASIPALREFARSVTPEVLAGGLNGNVAAILARLVLIAILAPLSEELFFRGWLWEALWRRGYAPVTTACLTAIPWLLLHGIDSIWRVLVLVPAAVIFSVARHLGGSVRASLAVHMTNNGAAVAVQTLAALFGHDA
jgi:membrane protease YdiL (CAAX protease family)